MTDPDLKLNGKPSILRAHSRQIALRYSGGSKTYQDVWYEDFKEIWPDKNTAVAAFLRWRKESGR